LTFVQLDYTFPAVISVSAVNFLGILQSCVYGAFVLYLFFCFVCVFVGTRTRRVHRNIIV
jgi:hypothetical protein